MASILQEFKHPKPTLTTDWTNFELKHPHPRAKYKPVLQPFKTGTKVNTRNLEAYRTRGLEDERIDIRKDNYQRRQQQMDSHGFNAKKEKPYKGIGDPFYLDLDKLMLHALGQLEEKEEERAGSSSSDEDDIIKITSKSKEPIGSSSSTPQFRLKRQRKDLHTIQKEVNHNRNVIRNVRLGHGLFDIIKQEQNSKQAAVDEQLRLKAERMRTEWQPPKQESSSDEDTDNDLEDDVDLSSETEDQTRSFMNQENRDSEEDIDDDADSETSPDHRDKTVMSSVNFREDVESSPMYGNKALLSMPRPHTSASTKKKKQKVPRPYTPHFINIIDDVKENNGPSDALFRQLCALHWILEAMRNCDDSGIKMTAIMSCWKLINIGGTPTLEDVTIRDKEIEKDWKKFREQDGHSGNRDRFNSRLYSQRRGTTAAKKSAPWRTSLAGSVMGLSSTIKSGAEEDDTHGEDEYREDETPSKIALKNVFSKVFVMGGLGASRMSVDTGGSKTDSEMAAKTDESIDKQESAVIEKWKQEQQKVAEEKQKLAKTAAELKRSADVAKIEQLVRQSLNQTDKVVGRQDRADVHFIRPKSSPALVNFKAMRSSLRYENMAGKISNEFRKLQEEKALLLHEELEHREKQRMMICQNKFIAINNQRTTSFHKALRQMRERSDKLFIRPTDEQMKKKQQEEQGNWLTDLLRNIPDDLKKQWHYKQIIDKFNSKFGSAPRSAQRRATVIQIEGFGQQHSKIKFLKVLERLREWEICSPDISAAIEFCREKIVKMSVEQFEEWFQNQFPKVVRPQTAPPVKKKEDNAVVKQNSATTLAVPRRGASAYRKLIRPMTTG